jgi:membrane protein DedA with SNARE-associated domain
VALAWLRCPLWLFLGASWLGGTVSLVFETSIGAGLADAMGQSDSIGIGLLMHREVLLPLGAIALLALLPLLLERVARWRRRRTGE